MIKQQIQPLTVSYKVFNWLMASVLNFCLVLLLFLCTTNTLVNFSLDKLMFFFVPVIIAFVQPGAALLKAKEFALIVLFIILISISSILNLTLAPMIFFPIIGLSFAFIIRRYPHLILRSLYYAILIHMICGLALEALAFIGIATPYVSGYIKGFSFLFASRGFTTTPQTFGTLCLVWTLIYFLRKKMNLNKPVDRVFYVINILATFSCLSRSTLIFWMLILFFKDLKLFISIITLVCAFMIKFFDEIITFVASSQSLIARDQLLEGFKISFIQSNSFLVYLFGKGTNQLSPEIASRVKWVTRRDFENGYTMLLHSYGSVGLAVYLFICFLFIYQFAKIGKWGEVFILFYYFFVTQYFTQEFVSVTFYLLMAVMFLSYDVYKSKIKRPLYVS